MTDFIVLIRDSESAPPRYLDTVGNKEDAGVAIEECMIGEGQYLAFPIEAAITRTVRMQFSVEENGK